MPIVTPLGAAFLSFLAVTGRITLFGLSGVSHIFRPPFYPRLIGRQMVEIGYFSLPVVGLTALFTRHGTGAAKLDRIIALQRR